MKLTIGMACHTDFNGVYMTVNNLRLNHNLKNCELVVIDNNPDSEEGHHTSNFLTSVQEIPVKYVPYRDLPVTSQSRNEIFKQATGDAVLVLDSHVFVFPHAIENLKNYYTAHPETKDLLSGLLYMDNLSNPATHFNPIWRDQMWGIWASAWKTHDGTIIQTHELNGKLVLLEMDGTPYNYGVNVVDWAGHEKYLQSRGFRPLGFPGDEVFEIPAMGLGLFSCRKDAWLGFNPMFREFGGEECYIHEKYRQAGHKNLCLPFLGWIHRWWKPGGAKYTFNIQNKFRNYILGLQELGLDIQPAVDHFKAYLSEDDLQATLKNPKLYRPTPTPPRELDDYSSRVDLYNNTKSVVRDLDKHADVLRHMAGKCEVVVEMSKRRESSVFLLAGNPTTLISFQEEASDPLLERQKQMLKKETNSVKTISWTLNHTNLDNMPESIPQCDLLFLDTRHLSERLSAELDRYHSHVNKYIMIHDTHIYGNKDEGNGPGLGESIRKFLKENPEWFILYHNTQQYGLTTLCRVAAEKPTNPVTPFNVNCGVGTEIKKLLGWFGIKSSPTCQCNKRAREMDTNGIAWCETNKSTIFGWLKEEYENRKKEMILPFSATATNMLINIAIRRAKKKVCE